MVTKFAARALVGAATVAATLARPATAHADLQNFQSPSGNIYCILDGNGADCDVSDHTYQLPPPPECAQTSPGAIASRSKVASRPPCRATGTPCASRAS